MRLLSLRHQNKVLGNPSKKNKKYVENSTSGLSPPPMTENMENFQKKKTKKKFKKPYKAQNKAIFITFKNFGKFFKIFEKIQRGDPWKKKF